MTLNIIELTENDTQKKKMNGTTYTDLKNDLFKTHNEHNLKKEDTILNLPISEVERQCQEYHVEEPFDYPLNTSQNTMDLVIEGGNKILTNEKVLRKVRNIYKRNNN